MMKKIVLAEKPSVARDIARVLRCGQKGNGFFEGAGYVVTWGLGHLVTLAEPESYGDQYKAWKMEDLPMLPVPLKLEVIKETKGQFHNVKTQLQRKDVTEIIIATDAGREGELVARWILEMAKVKKPIKRLWISSVTDKAIQDGFSQLKSGQAYEALYASAAARAEADWLVGINATRALTCKHNAQLSCGRVQSPTLAMIAKREEEIKNFKPVPFYGLTAIVDNQLKLTWQDRKTKEFRSFDKEQIDAIQRSLTQKEALVTAVEKTVKKSFAPQLFDLTELQRDANKRFGFSPKETSNVMQRLYENHKILTYPRTDSRYLSTDLVGTLTDRIKACGVGNYGKFAGQILRSGIKTGPHMVDNSKVSDHHAIIPTEQPVMLHNLSDAERKVYDLVVKRFFAVLMPAYEYEQITISVQLQDEKFIARGKRVLVQGWREVLESHNDEGDGDEELREQLFPDITKGHRFKVQSLTQTKGETKPPARFNEATLLSAMENPAHFMEPNQQQHVQTLKNTGGLGTVATRADIIEKLFNSFLVEKIGKEIRITRKGLQLLELVPTELRTPLLTAEWERKLEMIAKGTMQKQVFVDEMRKYATRAVSEIAQSTRQFKHDNVTHTKCPDCAKPMLEVNHKKGKMLVCQDRECGHRKSLSKNSNARCPNCHKKLELRGDGDAQTFYCLCGHREKLSAFLTRREESSKGSKNEIAKFLNEQKQASKEQEPLNSALADALAKLTFE